MLTSRAENFLRGNPDLADTIARLQSYAEAGAAHFQPTSRHDGRAVAGYRVACLRDLAVL